MDYSLLLVTEILPESQRTNGSVRKYKMKYDRNSVQSIDGKEACHFGIIDYLQEWNFNKKVEALYKHHLKHKNKHKISAVPPEPYQKRFCQFIEDNILVSKKKQKVKKAQELSKVQSAESFEDLFDLKSIRSDYSIHSINSMSMRSSEHSGGRISEDS